MDSCIIVVFTACLIANISSSGQAPAANQNCLSKLSPGMRYLKSHKIQMQQRAGKFVEYSYALAKGATYFVRLCNEGKPADSVRLVIYDWERHIVATNIDKAGIVPAVQYTCSHSGIFYFRYIPNVEDFAGESILAFSIKLKREQGQSD
jgi:hypothetical protein